MKTILVKNIEFGAGRPKVCVPIMGMNLADLENEIMALRSLEYDIIEWRLDHFSTILTLEQTKKAIELVKNTLKEKPLLATFRTSKEGGQMVISDENYIALLKWIIDSNVFDFIDVEYFMGDALVKDVVSYAHSKGVHVILSNHDFNKTPSYDEIITRLKKMQELDADIPKIAVMPTCLNDVLTLLKATTDMRELYADRPIITMSMGKYGLVSRLAGEVFGSCLTFGAAAKASAPGQIQVQDLNTILDILHKALEKEG